MFIIIKEIVSTVEMIIKFGSWHDSMQRNESVWQYAINGKLREKTCLIYLHYEDLPML